MSTLKISNRYSKLYQNPSEEPTEWRKIGAFDKVDNIIKLTNKFSHERILEIGCGDGAILKELSNRNYGSQLFGLEISQSLVNTVCKSKISKLEDCKLFNGYNIPFSDDEFDLVILYHVIEHLEYPRKLIYEAMRVGKFLIFEVPLEDTIRLKKNYDFNQTGHIRSGGNIIQTSIILNQYIHPFFYHVIKLQFKCIHNLLEGGKGIWILRCDPIFLPRYSTISTVKRPLDTSRSANQGIPEVCLARNLGFPTSIVDIIPCVFNRNT